MQDAPVSPPPQEITGLLVLLETQSRDHTCIYFSLVTGVFPEPWAIQSPALPFSPHGVKAKWPVRPGHCLPAPTPLPRQPNPSVSALGSSLVSSSVPWAVLDMGSAPGPRGRAEAVHSARTHGGPCVELRWAERGAGQTGLPTPPLSSAEHQEQG